MAMAPPLVRPARRRHFDRSRAYRNRVDPGGLQAAAAIVGSDDESVDRESFALSGQVRAKQREVWGYYDSGMCGELWFTGRFFANAMRRVNLSIATLDDDGHRVPCVDEEGKVLEGIDATGYRKAVDTLAQLRSKRGSQKYLLGQYGLNMGLAGECHLVGEDLTTPVQGLTRTWDILSTIEFFPAGKDEFKRVRAPGASAEIIKADSVHAIRMWQPHPTYVDLADAAPLALRGILEELTLLTLQVRSEALSRLANNGILIVADEIDAPDDEEAGEDDEGGDPWTRDFLRYVSAAISDKASAAGKTPYIMRIPYEYVDKGVRWIDTSKVIDQLSIKKREEAVERFAQGSDLPVEVVKGHMNTTFANAAQIDEDIYKVHIEPKCETLVEDWTIGYLWPSLGDNTFVIDYDASDLVVQPDRSKEYGEAHKDFVISDQARRRAIGATESDAPDDEEVASRIAIQRAIHTRETVQATDTGKFLDVPAIEAEIAGEGGATTTPAATTPPTVTPAQAVAAAAVGVIETTADRAVQFAAKRLRARGARNSSMKASLAGVDDRDVGVVLGRDRALTLVDDADLWRGEFDSAVGWYRKIDPEGLVSFTAELVRVSEARLFSPRADACDVQWPSTAS